MRHYAKLLRATPTALLMLVVLAGVAVAEPIEDATAAYEPGDYATAYRLLRPLADQGDALAQTNLGFMYANGRGVPQDYSKALEWFGKAADQGFAIAQTNLGVMYYMRAFASAATNFRKPSFISCGCTGMARADCLVFSLLPDLVSAMM
jgi:TPR repeat protein